MSGHDELLRELGTQLFASLPRSDQRRMALTYVRGLLTTRGRKSFRNMALSLGGPRLEQSLHHFVSCSAWDWAPVARAVADIMTPVAPPSGWVLRNLVTPREGDSTVGVHKRFLAGRGQVVNAQYAVGLWAASPRGCYPLAWRLLLPPEWLEDDVRRTRASIPDSRVHETPVECAAEAYLSLAAELRGALPVVMDLCGPGIDTAAAVHRLRSAGIPFMVRVYRTLRLTVLDPTLRGLGPGPVSTYQILAAAESLRGQPADPGPRGEGPPCTLAAAVRVRSPHHPVAHAPDGSHDPYDLLLLRTRTDAGRQSDEVWLTDMLDADSATLLHMTALPRGVDDAFVRVTERIGIRDFTGRSYGGWNRHTTLASAAHALALLSDERTDLLNSPVALTT
ncbi:IS701 family transposase [Streptomyces cahuitamycinicus]|uniref:Transposase n=1 Tax=Streptomyces cahuitamycinicus TaxID=2070367 RepID=A0A2N8TM14_9ACTN|nr:transposase [Streptomyces cahuitamycinicus]PNG20019.1 transposase [Streptomyces cahuitamycinicus]